MPKTGFTLILIVQAEFLDCHGTGVAMAPKTPIKKFQDLNLSNAYLFAATLEDAETCRITLEILLGIKVDSVTVHAEHTVLFSRDYRSIRLDIYSQDESYNSYNVEMQVENEGNLPKRSRYHQAEMDVMSMPPGSNFNDLKPNYVVFICCFDPFGDGLFRYTFTNRCAETGAELGDGTAKIFLNTRGTNAENIPTDLIHFLEYVENSTEECVAKQDDNVIRRIHQRVTSIKENRRWEQKYMRFEELLQKEYKEGLRAGHDEGLRTMLLLTQKLLEDGEVDKIPLLSNNDFLKELCNKYGIASEIMQII